jgi:hypothetical protein
MKINDLPGWPPEPGGAFENLESWPASGQAVLKKVLNAHHNWVAFTCSFEGREHPYDFETPDKPTALRIKAILDRSIGQTLLAIGEADLPDD